MNTVSAILFFGALAAVYIVLFLANKKTPVPPGCENLRADCEGCKDINCCNHPSHHKGENA